MTEFNAWLQVYGTELTVGMLIALTGLLLWVVFLQLRLRTLHRRYQAAMTAVEAGIDLETWLAQQQETTQEQAKRIQSLEEHQMTLEQTLAEQAGHVGVVRFNPFQDSGGDQSFAIAWVDDQQNGVVMSSLYNRAGVRVYAKPLDKGNSSYTLTDEEREAIELAKKNGKAEE